MYILRTDNAKRGGGFRIHVTRQAFPDGEHKSEREKPAAEAEGAEGAERAERAEGSPRAFRKYIDVSVPT